MARQFIFRFVATGTLAPEHVAPHELWLAVGGGIRAQVLDHRADSRLATTSNAVLTHIDDLIRRPLAGQSSITIVVSERPDLDCVCAAWLAKELWEGQGIGPQSSHYNKIAQIVSEGEVDPLQVKNPFRCWPLVMRELMDAQAGSQTRMAAAMKSLDATLRVLRDGGRLVEAANAILTTPIRNKLSYGQLRKIIAALEVTPDSRFDQRVWQKMTAFGTVGCAIGAYILQDPDSGLRLVYPKGSEVAWLAGDDRAQDFEAVAEYIGVDSRQAKYLFGSHSYSPNAAKCVDPNFSPPRQTVLTRLRKFAEDLGGARTVAEHVHPTD